MKKVLILIPFLFILIQANGQQTFINSNQIHQTCPNSKNNLLFRFYYNLDLIPLNFNDFRDVLQSYNVDLMNKSSGTEIFSIQASYKRFTCNLGFGIENYTSNYNDSLKIDFNTNAYMLDVGFNVIDNRNIYFGPRVGLRWYRYRLTNGLNENKIELTDYMLQREIDIRFNQAIGFLGFDFNFKLNGLMFMLLDNVGLYGGYIFKLHDIPLIYSKSNRLSTNNKINYQNFNIGVCISKNLY
jgi:hypothetical protein